MTDVDRRTDDDLMHARAIMGETDPEVIARRVFEYYHDADRADRTPRLTMYLHIGLLAGALMRACVPRETSQNSPTSQKSSQR